MTRLSNDFIRKVAHALQEEEVDVYVLTLYCMNTADLEFFQEKDRERVRKIFDILMEDTKHHAELLKLIIEVGQG